MTTSQREAVSAREVSRHRGACFLLVTFLCTSKEKVPAVGQPPTSTFRTSTTRRRRSTTALLTIATALNLIISPVAHALKSDANQPLQIRARSVEINEKTGVAVYRGAVSLRQGTLHLQADRVEVVSRNEQIQTIRASGNPVKVRTQTDKNETIDAEAKRADYFAPRRQLDLYDNAVIKRNDDVLRGAVVHYNLDSRALSAEGDDKGQVWAVIQPSVPTP